MSVCSQTEIQSCDIVSKEEHEKMKKEFEKLKAKHHELLLKCAEKEVDKVQNKSNHAAFDENDFRNNDDKVRFFIGLTNWEVLEKLFLFVKPNLVGHPSLTPFQQLIITLMRLRLASSGVELSYHFGIHPSTASRVFSDVIQMLYIRLKFLIVWPERTKIWIITTNKKKQRDRHWLYHGVKFSDTAQGHLSRAGTLMMLQLF